MIELNYLKKNRPFFCCKVKAVNRSALHVILVSYSENTFAEEERLINKHRSLNQALRLTEH